MYIKYFETCLNQQMAFCNIFYRGDSFRPTQTLPQRRSSLTQFGYESHWRSVERVLGF